MRYLPFSYLALYYQPKLLSRSTHDTKHCFYDFINRDQLTRSLEHLNTKFADILFIHNPEYYLMSTVRDVKDIEVNVKSKLRDPLFVHGPAMLL